MLKHAVYHSPFYVIGKVLIYDMPQCITDYDKLVIGAISETDEEVFCPAFSRG